MMHSVLRPAALLATTLLLLGGCDIIDDPVIPLTINYRGEAAPPTFDALSSGPQHVLLEDFTAHQCGNCPPAGVLAEQLAEEHDGLVHVLAVHAGSCRGQRCPLRYGLDQRRVQCLLGPTRLQVNPIGRVNRRGGRPKSPPQQLAGLVDAELA